MGCGGVGGVVVVGEVRAVVNLGRNGGRGEKEMMGDESKKERKRGRETAENEKKTQASK